MNFKFNRRKIKYVVKPEERIVIGWINMCDNDITSVGWELKDDFYFLLSALKVKDIWQQDERVLKAVSRCDERDKFDEKVGKKIVADILEKKYHTLMMKKYKQIERKMDNILDNVDKLTMMHKERLDELQTRIDEYNEE